MEKNQGHRSAPPVPRDLCGLHLDLKYAMPNKRALLDWVARLPRYGINALLIEYEDKFPYAKYPFLRDPDAFTPEELKEFLKTARGAGLMCIPLVQSLSHLEFALAHDRLAPLREAPDIHTQICPSNPDAVRFVQELHAEVLAYHPEAPFFHCGGDEAWFLGTCKACAAWKERVGPIQVWADHQKKIIQPVLDAGKRPILWDDIFRNDRATVGRVGLPREAVLHAWNYAITKLGESPGDAGDAEFGGPGGVLKEIGIYKAAGYDSVAGPCFNYGQLFPRIGHSIENTRVWARKIRAEGMLGMLNTAWAVFHVPVQATDLLAAATGELCKNPDADLGIGWQKAWLAQAFGARADGVPEAMDTLATSTGVDLKKKYGRGFNPIVYDYMNMVLHYPGRQEERRKRGAYPLDWNTIDFVALYRKGVEETRIHASRKTICADLERLINAYGPARETVKAFAAGATRRKTEARMFSLFADMKMTSAETFRYLLEGQGDPARLRREMAAQKEPLQEVLAQFYEPIGQARMMRAWWEPATTILGEEVNK